MARYITTQWQYHTFTLLVGMFDFPCEGFVLIPAKAPTHDPVYMAEVERMNSVVEFYQAAAYLQDFLDSDAKEYDYDWSKDEYLLDVMNAFELDLIPIECSLYEAALSLREHNPFIPATRKPSQSLKGYVYLMTNNEMLCKIGYSKDPAQRLKQIAREEEEVYLHCRIPSDDMCLLEYQLHQRFRVKRVRGEWFSLSHEEKTEIIAMGEIYYG
jgi:hypothetical protein